MSRFGGMERIKGLILDIINLRVPLDVQVKMTNCCIYETNYKFGYHQHIDGSYSHNDGLNQGN